MTTETSTGYEPTFAELLKIPGGELVKPGDEVHLKNLSYLSGATNRIHNGELIKNGRVIPIIARPLPETSLPEKTDPQRLKAYVLLTQSAKSPESKLIAPWGTASLDGAEWLVMIDLNKFGFTGDLKVGQFIDQHAITLDKPILAERRRFSVDFLAFYAQLANILSKHGTATDSISASKFPSESSNQAAIKDIWAKRNSTGKYEFLVSNVTLDENSNDRAGWLDKFFDTRHKSNWAEKLFDTHQERSLTFVALFSTLFGDAYQIDASGKVILNDELFSKLAFKNESGQIIFFTDFLTKLKSEGAKNPELWDSFANITRLLAEQWERLEQHTGSGPLIINE